MQRGATGREGDFHTLKDELQRESSVQFAREREKMSRTSRTTRIIHTLAVVEMKHVRFSRVDDLARGARLEVTLDLGERS